MPLKQPLFKEPNDVNYVQNVQAVMNVDALMNAWVVQTFGVVQFFIAAVVAIAAFGFLAPPPLDGTQVADPIRVEMIADALATRLAVANRNGR